jgi:hypothetical protein
MSSFNFTAKLAPMKLNDFGGSEVLAYFEMRPRVIDFLLMLKPCLNSFGYIHEGVSTKEFNQLTNSAPKYIVLDPGHLLPMDPLMVPQHKQNRLDFNLQEAGSAYIKAEIISAFPEYLLVPLKVGGSLYGCTVKSIIKAMDRQLLTMTEKDFDFLKAEVARPYVPNSPVRTVLANEVTRNLALLADHGQPMATMEAVRAIKGKFDPHVFERCWDQYSVTNGPIASQSAGSLIAAIIKFVEERMNVGKPLADVALKVAATTTAPSDLMRLEQEIQALRILTERALAATAPFKELHYCHTHGPMDESGQWHDSIGCTRPGPAHDKTATVRNHKGGRVERWVRQQRKNSTA